MDTRLLGRTGLPVSRLGVGLAEIGGLDLAEARQAAEVLNLALDSGVTFFDTSACYDNSEALIGKTMAHRRAEFVLATKAGHVVGGYQGEEWTAQTVLDSIDRSLMRLRTDITGPRSAPQQLRPRGARRRGDPWRPQEAQRAGKTFHRIQWRQRGGALWAMKSGLFGTLQTSWPGRSRARRDLFEIAENRRYGHHREAPDREWEPPGAWRLAEPLRGRLRYQAEMMMRGLGPLHGAHFRIGSRWR